MKELKRYKGFMYIKCPHCGEVKVFCAKEPMTHFHCFDCGHNMILEGNLKTLWVYCECGSRFRYKTNMTEKMFDMKCLNCGNPVAVEWNEKKHIYRPIKE